MSECTPNYQDSCLITCILQAGKGQPLLERLHKKQQILSVNIYHARGIGSSAVLRKGVAKQVEQDVLVVLVEAERVEEVFSYLYRMAKIYKPHHGVMYMERAICSGEFDFSSMPMLTN